GLCVCLCWAPDNPNTPFSKVAVRLNEHVQMTKHTSNTDGPPIHAVPLGGGAHTHTHTHRDTHPRTHTRAPRPPNHTHTLIQIQKQCSSMELGRSIEVLPQCTDTQSQS